MTGMTKAVHGMDRVSGPIPTEATESTHTTLIDQLLSEQRTLTAVERFSQQHKSETSPIQSKYYKDLIPIRKPSSGEQYAFEVDMDKCTGCKACVVACHSLNGLKDKETWRDVGTIRGVVDGIAEQQTITSACHHCIDPACLSGCPVGAYEKLEETGIVKHLDDQCIGCQYCSLKCPYDVPKYDESLGIVRKCDMCHERLAEGEAPACVQSCPNGAISIEVISTEEYRRKSLGGGSMVAGAFRSDYTLPTTNFRTKRKLSAAMLPADDKDLTPSHNHVPLVWMLMLTQVAVGTSLMGFMHSVFATPIHAHLNLALTALAVLFGMVGLVSSLLHLGSPLGAWRVFLGIKTSWLSREVILFGLWMPALLINASLVWYPFIQRNLPSASTWGIPNFLTHLTGLVAVVLGLLSVFCSVMVYVDTKRAFWSLSKTLTRFYGTTFLGGFTVLGVAEALLNHQISMFTTVGFFTALICKMRVEYLLLKPAKEVDWSLAKKSALIQTRSLIRTVMVRWVSFILALLCFSLGETCPLAAATCLVLVLVGEWFERSLFFQAVVTLKMPGELNQSH